MSASPRKPLSLRSFGIPEGCRVRGESVSRFEGFTDAAFAFALTLLVISLEVPRSFDDLVDGLRGIPAFAACFAILIWLWCAHYRFFRRYGLEDAPTIALNAAFLFVVMLYVFPLKFSFTVFLGLLTGIQPSNSGRIALHQVDDLFVLYGLGFIAAFGLLGWMTWRAWNLRDELGLNEMERLVTREELARFFSFAGLGCVCVLTALALPDRWAGMSGMLYGFIGAIEAFLGRRFGRPREALLTEMRLKEMQLARLRETGLS